MPIRRTDEQRLFNGLVGGNIRYLREYQDMTRNELAKKVGYSWKTMGKIEDGETSCHLYNLTLCAKVLGVELNDLGSLDIWEKY